MMRRWLGGCLLCSACAAFAAQGGRVPPNLACLYTAARHYQIDSRVLLGILRAEGGWSGLRQPNTNGSYDMGPMQINSLWLPQLARMGVTEAAVVHDACINIAVGSWILAGELKRVKARPNSAAYWQAVGRYHSARAFRNVNYALKVWRYAKAASLPAAH